MSGAALTSGQAVRALAALAVTRARRGKALWIAAALAALPIVIAVILVAVGRDEKADLWRAVFETAMLLLPVVPSVVIASSLADELEERTSAYLWSRALPRWSIVAGKLIGLAPVCAAMMMAGAVAGWGVLGGAAAVPADAMVRGVAGIGAAALAGSAVAAMWATLVPKHAVAVSVVWLLFLDAPLGETSIRLHHLSASFVAHAIAGFGGDLASGVITFVALTGVATAVAVWRIGRME